MKPSRPRPLSPVGGEGGTAARAAVPARGLRERDEARDGSSPSPADRERGRGGEGSPSASWPIRWGPDGLIPAVAQDEATGDVLMVGFVNAAALEATMATGVVHYWSRGRNELWRKGATSGHEQELVCVALNCERNSLLLTVRQRGAVCHDGYPTCFYRRLHPDGSLTIVRERAFDPTAVYRRAPAAVVDADDTDATPAGDLERASRRLWGAYAWLRDRDLSAVSATSRRLRAGTDPASARVADELRELAGVLDGSHVHADPAADTLLEASQVLYWVTVAALWHGLTWEQVRPDRAFAAPEPASTAPTPPPTQARPSPSGPVTDLEHRDQTAQARERLLVEAVAWSASMSAGDLAIRCRSTLSALAAACRAVGLEPAAVVAKDLGELRERPYLADYFAAVDAAAR